MNGAAPPSLLSRRSKSRRLPFILAIISFAFALAASANELSRLGEGADQLTPNDVNDIRVLAAQILPAKSPIAIIECFAYKGGEGTGRLRRLHVYGKPVEQTPRLWSGFY